MKKTFLVLWSISALAWLLLAGCGSSSASNEGLKVVASTTLVGDVVQQVGGRTIDLSVLLPVGADPHTFEPRPQDIAALSRAQVVFINGLGLEEALEPALEANAKGKVVAVSDGIEVLPFNGMEEGEEHEGEEHEGEEHEGEEGHHHAAGDPHTWTDPNNVIIWAQNIAAALAQADPENATTYQANAEAYIARLSELDVWIRQQVEQVPHDQRKLVTDHAILGYFAQEYGFEQVGLVVPSLSTNAAPSAQELAALEDAIREQGVRAILVGRTVNPAISGQLAQDTGIKLVFIYSGSLGEAGSGVETYLDYMRYNVQAIVDALK